MKLSPGKRYLFYTLAISTLAIPIPAFAAYNPMDGLNAKELPDSILSNLRGKYVADNSIMYFGVSMITNWQNGNLNISAGIQLSVNAQLQPTLDIITSDNGGVAPTSGTNQVSINGTGLGHITGTGQVIQIGGNGNSVTNDINMNLVNSGNLNNGMNLTSLQPGVHEIQLTGANATVSVLNDNLMLGVSVAGQGQVMQKISPGSITQSAQIGGDFNSIGNNINIEAAIQPQSISAIGQQVLSSIRILN
ncbi:MAG: hypothetical protein KGI54_12155 [Pseudomonadota bacterium]|nr:hypothetical protein [Pseudomonadota bacterium]